MPPPRSSTSERSCARSVLDYYDHHVLSVLCRSRLLSFLSLYHRPAPAQPDNNNAPALADLRALLRAHGAFPAPHRPLAWRLLLSLPRNRAAFAALTARGPHAAAARHIAQRFPLRSRRDAAKLTALASALAHWSPVFGEAENVPAVVFPFLRAFRGNDLAAFECAMTVLTWWGRAWLVTFPQPPVPVLVGIEAALRRHDARLAAHLRKCGADTVVYGWSLLRSIFSEVLAGDAWLRLWDHIFAAAHDPQLLNTAVVAFAIANRDSLLAARSRADVEAFYHSQQVPGSSRLLHVMNKADASSQPQRHSDAATAAAVSDAAAAQRSVALLLQRSPQSAFPLPKGGYPAFEGYPQFVLDWQLEERRRVAGEVGALAERRALAEQLRDRTRALEREEEEAKVGVQRVIKA
ncbi:hypothetical protein JKP88DRAFT_162613 [Tribonema minus]|uniref:Rab-GAP TBC domain-containing protein n=1 Tax=Tribonema minus TaxID=303371 RepID=A0A836CHE3_9STRA|nr:hypothetical protein JKP88DRAFT_162613 [Tribonema minus]